MKQGWKQIVGKTIDAVVVGKSTKSPHRQVFLRFTDGTSLEIYGDAFTCANGVLRRADPEAAIDPRHGRVVALCWKGDEMPQPEDTYPPNTLVDHRGEYYVRAKAVTVEIDSQPELEAWKAAQAAIAMAWGAAP